MIPNLDAILASEHRNLAAFCVALFIAVSWVEFCKLLAYFKLLLNWQRRKLLHVFTGPLFILTWPLFSDDQSGATWAALVPLAMTVKFVSVGFGLMKDEDLVISASRSNSRAELLRGPTLYGVVFILTTLVYWKSVRSVMCLMILCFGDGCAELTGRKFGRKNKLFYSPDKSLAGFIGFVIASFVTTYLLVTLYGVPLFGPSFANTNTNALAMRLLIDCIVAGLVETLPIPELDNITIFVTAITVDSLLYGS